jgi:thermitase
MRVFYVLALALIFCTAFNWVSVWSIACDEPIQVAAISPEQEPVYSQPSAVEPTDEHLERQWAISKIMASQAWQVTSGDPSVIIAVLDTGIDRWHEDLAGKVVAEVNFADSPIATDIYGHGTHTAGIIAAAAEDGLGMTGVAYKCRLMNVKIADEGGTWSASVVAKGIIWAVDNGANVINMSLSASEPSSDLEQAVNYAWSKGAVVVCAAGNRTGTKPIYPAFYTSCIAVAATDSNDSLASWSGCGDWVDVAAPGVHIFSTLPFNDYGYKSGTSMAAAYVSGLAGLLFAIVKDGNGNGYVNDEVEAAMKNGCDRLDIEGIGKGRINAFKAVTQQLDLK